MRGALFFGRFRERVPGGLGDSGEEVHGGLGSHLSRWPAGALSGGGRAIHYRGARPTARTLAAVAR